jgi:hypothetical protein
MPVVVQTVAPAASPSVRPSRARAVPHQPSKIALTGEFYELAPQRPRDPPLATATREPTAHGAVIMPGRPS